jgi:hypothetical protein
VLRAAATPGADRYRKHFTAQAHLWVLLLHVLWGSRSLRITAALLAGLDRWWQQWGMASSISFSQLARSSTSRPSACAETLATLVLALARRQAAPDPTWRLLQRTVALDSTFLRLSSQLSPWSVCGRFPGGVRVQTMLEVGRHIPARLWLTGVETNDHTALWQQDLRPWRGWTLLMDRGYYGHQQLVRLLDAGVHLVMRGSDQAHYQVLTRHAIPAAPTPDGDVLLSDETVLLGSPNNRRGAVVAGLRLIQSRNRRGEVWRVLTDRHDLTATEVVQLYRKRWQIELFYRWLKHQLGLIRPLGRSRAAVWLTVLIVLVVALLAVVLDQRRPPGMSRVAWLHHTALALLLEVLDDG